MKRVLPVLFSIFLICGCDIGRGGGGDGKPDAPQTTGNSNTGEQKKAEPKTDSQPEDGSAESQGQETKPKEPVTIEPTDGDGPSSCLYTSPVKMCFEYEQSVEAIRASCLSAQGEASASLCDRAESVGVCAVTGSDGQQVRTYYYPPQEHDTVKQTCESGNGVFSEP